jgi:hypothetical protein
MHEGSQGSAATILFRADPSINLVPRGRLRKTWEAVRALSVVTDSLLRRQAPRSVIGQDSLNIHDL